MGEATVPPTGIELREAQTLRLIPGRVPPLSPEHRAARDRIWDQATRTNPTLFDGPAVVCAGVTWEPEPVITWAPTSYRHHALRRVPGAPWLPSLFVAVAQPTTNGLLLVGRMSSTTVAPGRWQLPGGGVEPPTGPGTLDEAALRREAARELAEETGGDASPDELTPWLISLSDLGNVGVLFRAQARPASLLERHFQTLVEQAPSVGTELDRIALVRTRRDLSELPGTPVDYLPVVLDRFTREGSR